MENKDVEPLQGVAHYLKEFYKTLEGEESENLKKDIISKDVFEKVNSRLVFRGLPNHKWDVVSSAGRRLYKEDKNKQDDFIRYHVNLIENARSHGYGGLKAGSELSDLEILAEIQHYGGATCLADFSTNFLMALWFATERNNPKSLFCNEEQKVAIEYPDDDTDGKIVWLDLGGEKNFNAITYYVQKSNTDKRQENDTIQKILSKVGFNFEAKQRKVEPCFWLWQPPRLNNRIDKQDSIFLFGLSAFSSSKLDFKEVIIEKKDKEVIRKELSILFGISAETVYHDLSGYALEANGVKTMVSEKILPKNRCLDNAKESIKRGNYSVSVSYIDQGIQCKNNKNDNTVCINGKQKCCNHIGEFLFWRGTANENRNRIDEAVLNLYESSSKLENYYKTLQDNDVERKRIYNLICESYRKQSIIHYQKNDYRAAIESDKKLDHFYYKNFDGNGEENGVDAVFALLELSILTLDNSMFSENLRKVQRIKPELNNGRILSFFLENFGNAIFNSSLDWETVDSLLNQIDSLTNKIITDFDKVYKIEPSNNFMLIGYYFWNYSDIINWIDFLRKESIDKSREAFKQFVLENSDRLTLLAQKAQEAQSKLLNRVFEKSESTHLRSKK
jgi:hypothetical protein